MADWSQEQIDCLRELWDEGHSTAQIAARMGLTKNAIVCKAHRLDLEARPSPIIRNGDPKPRAPRRVKAARTLPVLASLLPAVPIVVPPQEATKRPDPPAKPVPAKPPGRIIPCCWPIGDPGTKSFRFCEKPSEPDRPYCSEHVKRAYQKAGADVADGEEAFAT